MRRIALLAAAAVCAFGGAALILFCLLPRPLLALDYLVIGAVATAVALLASLAVLLCTWSRAADALPKLRSKRPDE